MHYESYLLITLGYRAHYAGHVTRSLLCVVELEGEDLLVGVGAQENATLGCAHLCFGYMTEIGGFV